MMNQPVKLPRLLDGSWQEIRRVHPLEMSLTMTVKSLSFAQMTLEQEDAEGIGIGAFMELFTNQGSMGVFRVQTVIHEEKAVTLELSHAPVTLTDAVIPGEIKETEETLRAALTRLLDAQPVKHWTLGAVDVPDEKTMRWSYAFDMLWEKITEIMTNYPGYQLAYDTSVYPWVLSVRKAPEEVACELRLNRNLASAMVEYDRSELCTRLYIDGIAEPLDADTIDLYGVVSHAMVGDQDYGEDYWREEGRLYLERHKHPALTISLKAEELSHLTGEPFDRLTLGTMCRAALPDRGETVTQHIVELFWDDVYGKPDSVSVSMSNAEDTTSSMLSAIRASSRRSSTRIITKLRDVYRDIIEIDDVLTKRLHTVSIELDAVKSEIELKATAVHVSELEKRVSSAEITLDGVNAEIELKVNRNGVISAINLSPESVVIDAAKIDLRGYVTVNNLEAEMAEIFDLWAEEFSTKQLSADNVTCGYLDADEIVCGPLNASTLKLGGKDMTLHSAIQVCTRSATYYSNTADISYMDWNGNKKTATFVTGIAQAQSPSHRTISYIGPV